ncbi:MAG: hypothetical protein IPH72_34805 [Sandaracinaceae bacterium]|nr:hypothetical protein [Sandaracinaceae bacterium]
MPIPEPDLRETWESIADAPGVPRRGVVAPQDDGVDLETEVPWGARAAPGSYALDACGEEPDLGPRRGPVAHRTCLWLRKVDGLADGARDLPAPLRDRAQRAALAPRRHRPRHGAGRATTCRGCGPSRRGGRWSSIDPRCCCSSPAPCP